MLENFLKLIYFIFKDELNTSNRPSISNIIYFICGLIEFIIIINQFFPFCFSCSFFDEVLQNYNIINCDLLVKVTFFGLLIYALVNISRKTLIKVNKINTNRSFIAFMYTIEDIIDTFSAIFSLIFMLTFFIQFYKTQIVISSFYAWTIYIIVAIRFITFIGERAFAKNLEIVDKACTMK